MADANNPLPDQALSRIPASDVKRRGWRGMMRTVSIEGTVLVTNHGQPEAVILSAAAYSALAEQASQTASRVESELEVLRRRFDERLASLAAPGASMRLRAVMRGPARLRGKVKAGQTY